jgi:hypothetical protein
MPINPRRVVALALSLAALTASTASVYQHNQTDLEFVAAQDGTSNTIMFG